MTAKKKSPTADANFEGTLAQVEQIVEEIESGELPLQDVVSRFRTATEMINQCQAMLTQIEQQIKVMEIDKSADEGSK